MKTRILLLTLAVALPVLADEKPWPQKGDTVYVVGELTGLFGLPPAIQFNSITVPACDPVTVATRPKPNKLLIRNEARGAAFQLCAGWESLLHQKREACLQAKAVTFEKKQGCYSPVE
jgi:hypothetical protein